MELHSAALEKNTVITLARDGTLVSFSDLKNIVWKKREPSFV